MPGLDINPGSTVYRLPLAYWHCRWDTFDWSLVLPTSLRETLETFLADVAEGKRRTVLLTGKPGIGKTHLGVALYRAATVFAGTGWSTWLNVPAFCDRLKQGFGQVDAPDLWEDVQLARRLVVLDDLFGRELTGYESQQVLYRLIDTVYQIGASVVVTMNQPHTELTVRLNPHECSRLLGAATVIPMEGSDRRGRRVTHA